MDRASGAWENERFLHSGYLDTVTGWLVSRYSVRHLLRLPHRPPELVVLLVEAIRQIHKLL
jgi:hypothetical protein